MRMLGQNPTPEELQEMIDEVDEDGRIFLQDLMLNCLKWSTVLQLGVRCLSEGTGFEAGDVTKGQNFSITCRSASLHPNGTLNLLQATGGAVTTVRSQSVGNGSVTFRFPSSVFSEDGSYSCQYQTQVSGRTINSSLSDPAQITVTDVRLRGNNSCAGRVEVYHRGDWGTVCDDDWGLPDADVVCRQLGCGAAVSAPHGAVYGKGSGPILLSDVGCTGGETVLSQCPSRGWRSHNCTHGEDASVICFNSARFSCSAPSELYTNIEFDLYSSNAGNSIVTQQAGSPNTSVELTVSNVDPSHQGSYSCLYKVQGRTQTFSSNHSDSINIAVGELYANVTLYQLGGGGSCAGRVEVYHRGDWGTVCEDGWGLPDADVVCRQLGCGAAVSAPHGAVYGQGSGPILLNYVGCTGKVAVLSQCPSRGWRRHNCTHEKDASVICFDSGDVTKGQNFSITCRSASLHPNGTLNLLQATGGAVTTVRSQSVGNGSVTFRFPSSVFSEDGSYSCQYQTQVSGRTINSSLSDPAQITVTAVRVCNDKSLWGLITCPDASVFNPHLDVRLRGNNSCAGRVEVYHRGDWGTVCDDDWGLPDADVVCRQLGCGAAVSAPHGAVYGKGSGPILLSDVGCTGGETVLSQCPNRGWRSHNCTHGQDTSVICFDSDLRVTGGDSCAGRVEVYHRGDWGTVCDDDWGLPDADVVCRQLGCGAAVSAPHGEVYGQGSGPILLDNVGCTGGETVLSQCPNRGWRIHNCNHGEDASVICFNSDLRLQEGHVCAGRVEVYYRRDWGTVCEDGWGLPDADVVCRQLGCGAAVSAPGGAVYGQGSGPILLDNVGCSGGETVLSQCPSRGWRSHNCSDGQDASVICLSSGRSELH
ncbi:DMBT1 protein, partial [Amia calva]|nr:DMBT1 protein [Amia calva]